MKNRKKILSKVINENKICYELIKADGEKMFPMIESQ